LLTRRTLSGIVISVCAALAAIVAPMAALPAAAACTPGTAIGGTVGSPTGPATRLSAGCYVVTSDIYVPANVTFTLDPGVTLQFNATVGLLVQGDGTFVADASAVGAQPIILTTNAATPAAGQWMGIYFYNSYGTVKNVSVLYAGHNRYGTGFGIRLDSSNITMDAVTVDRSGGVGIENEPGAFPTITNSRVTNSVSHGVFVNGACPSITNITITGSGGYGLNLNSGIHCDPGATVLTAPANYTGNGNGNRIGLAGGTVTAVGRNRLPYFGVAYDVFYDITVSYGGTLTIDPGTTLRFGSANGLWVSGVLVLDASPTPTTPIVFTSANASPAAGQWMGIVFNNSGSGTLENVSVLYAGYNNLGNQFGLRFDNEGSTVDNVSVDRSAGHGIFLNGGCPGFPNTTLTNNGNYGLYMTYIQCDPALTGLSYTGNGNGNRIGFGGGTISTTGRNQLANLGFGYDVLGDITINNGATLTVTPGNTLRFGPTIGMWVYGTLVADASAAGAQPIVLTSTNATPAAGQWMGVFFNGGAGTLKNMSVQYAGYNRIGSQFGIRVDNVGTLPAWTKVTLASNAGTGLEVNGTSNVIITASNFRNGPAAKGITNNGSATNSVDARNSYWNASNGPTIASNPGGTGDAIIGTGATRVQYSPFSTTPV
jgi:hypothetical protein